MTHNHIIFAAGIMLSSVIPTFAIQSTPMIDLRSQEFQVLNYESDFIGTIDGLLMQNGNPPPDGGLQTYPDFSVSTQTGLLMSDTDYLTLAVFSDQNLNQELTGVWLEAASWPVSVMVGRNATGQGVFEAVQRRRDLQYVAFNNPMQETQIEAQNADVYAFTTTDPVSCPTHRAVNVPEGGSAWILLGIGLLTLVMVGKNKTTAKCIH